MTIIEMEDRLRQAFPGSDVVVIDTTGDQYHMEVRIAAPQFECLSRIKQHQAVMAVFDDELKSGALHALSVKTLNK
ncbi:MAG: BolA/IbaG family iron-sulfur metabolism protein [Pseudobdellovibrionaceae bacterium]|nr:BolA/IbaG family iron-sulfur metabolism protein [Bdellovibrionales bacterium]USN46200.1 MAG: BolA/IbaG family iron-sulfur metabolism protein [Pseudobdellovibrionaceae bacterium]